MKRTNIRPISNMDKKAITVTGTLFLPLRIGERAWISTQTHTFMTTAVERILEVSRNNIVFETRNTQYNLKYENIPNETEVMCA